MTGEPDAPASDQGPADLKVAEALTLLRAVGLPLDRGELSTPRRQRRVALALLAAADLKPATPWADAKIYAGVGSHGLSTREMIAFWNAHYGEKVSSGSYDDVRRKDLIYLVEAGLVLKSANKPNASTNDPTRKYAMAPGATRLVRSFGTPEWGAAVEEYRKSAGVLHERLSRDRAASLLPVTFPGGKTITLSPGPHNAIQKAIIEQFLPRYGFDAEVLYVGDTTNKSLYMDIERLTQLGFPELSHDMLPDVVAYSKAKNWLYLIEAVHSANPISQLRHLSLERMVAKCTAPAVYVSAFADRDGFGQWLPVISWETEVWLADAPDHLIHFNGGKFLGPHTVQSPEHT